MTWPQLPRYVMPDDLFGAVGKALLISSVLSGCAFLGSPESTPNSNSGLPPAGSRVVPLPSFLGNYSWQQVARDNQVYYYLDLSKIESNGSYRRSWLRIVGRTVTFTSARDREYRVEAQVSCSYRNYRFQGDYVHYLPSRSRVRVSSIQKQWKRLPTTTPPLFDVVC